MERKLSQYLPTVIRDYDVFRAITEGEQPEFDQIWSDVENVLDNQFISLAGNLGLSRWEKMLGLTPKESDTVPARRTRVLAAQNKRLPYTVRWLENWLSSLYGAENHREDLTDYTLTITLNYDVIPDAYEALREIEDALAEVIPCNMLLRGGTESARTAASYAYAACVGAEFEDGAAANLVRRDLS